MNEALVVALLAAIGSLVTVLLNALTGARKSQLDALCETVATLQETVTALQDENVRLRGRVDELERENAELRAELATVRRNKRL